MGWYHGKELKLLNVVIFILHVENGQDYITEVAVNNVHANGAQEIEHLKNKRQEPVDDNGRILK